MIDIDDLMAGLSKSRPISSTLSRGEFPKSYRTVRFVWSSIPFRLKKREYTLTSGFRV